MLHVEARVGATGRVPLVAFDRVVQIGADHITVRKALSANEPYFAGHYPGHPIYPGVYILETMNQAVGILAAALGATARVVELRSVRFLSPLRPGDVFECCCTMARTGARATISARCRSNGRTAASAELVYEWNE